MTTTKEKPAGTQPPAGEIRGADSLTTEVYHSKQPQEDHYNPENGTWDRQLPNPDLVVQLDDPPPAKPRIFDRVAWADGIVLARRYRGPTAAVFHRMTVRAGTDAGCFENVDNMALGLGLCRRSVQRAIKIIAKDGYMIVEERHRQTYLCRPDFTKRVSQSPVRVSQSHPHEGVTESPKGKPSSSKGKVKELTNKKEVVKKQPDTVKTFKPFEEEGATGVTNSPPRKTYDEVVEWVETDMPASATFWFVDGVLKRYEKQWWRPWTGRNPKSGFAEDTPRSKAVEKYMGSPEDWRRLRANLITKAFEDGGPFPVFDQHDGGNPKLKEPVLCFTCKDMTMAYGETNKVFTRVDGSDEIDKCDACLTPELVAVQP